tara:strand:- start:1 stop:720 length:720 start_codon:yes stop_codon:yes gene_type:complete
MRAIILAAGRGSRLLNLSSTMPKCMVTLKNKPLISYQIKSLSENNIENISVVAGYLKNKIKNNKITKFFENKIWNNTNMVYSLYMANEWLSCEDCIVSYGDIFYSKETVANLINTNDKISITYDINFKYLWEKRFINPLDDLETFKVDKDYYVIEIGKKVDNIKDVMGQFMGLIKITKEGWEDIKSLVPEQDMKELDITAMLGILIKNGYKVKGVPINDTWGEIDNQSDIKLYEEIYEL